MKMPILHVFYNSVVFLVSMMDGPIAVRSDIRLPEYWRLPGAAWRSVRHGDLPSTRSPENVMKCINVELAASSFL